MLNINKLFELEPGWSPEHDLPGFSQGSLAQFRKQIADKTYRIYQAAKSKSDQDFRELAKKYQSEREQHLSKIESAKKSVSDTDEKLKMLNKYLGVPEPKEHSAMQNSAASGAGYVNASTIQHDSAPMGNRVIADMAQHKVTHGGEPNVANMAHNVVAKSLRDQDVVRAASGIGHNVGKAIGHGTELAGKSLSSIASAASENPLTAAAIAGGAGLAYALRKRKSVY